MTHIYGDPSRFKDDMLDGFVAAYSRYVERVPGASGVIRAGGARRSKVALVVGGGSGHYPAFSGFIGGGMADGAVVGDMFTSPSAEQIYRVGRAVDGGAGLLFSFGNYAGDVLNFSVAQRRLTGAGIDTRTVVVTDDIASGDADDTSLRRGIAGVLMVFKATGAAAARGDDLNGVEQVAHRANERTRSLGVAFGGATMPGAKHPLFTVAEGSVEVGMGIHGEAGVRTVERMPAQELAATLLGPILAEAPADTDGRVAIVLNGLGATKYEELFVLWAALIPALERAGLHLVMPEVGEFVTSMDMPGCSLTVSWLDDELDQLWTAPAATPAFRRGDPSAIPDYPTQRVRADQIEADEQVSAGSEESCRAAAVARQLLSRVRKTLVENEDELGRIDAVAGDGDHGAGMRRGAVGADEAADAAIAAGAGIGSLLRAAGRAWGDQAGGTSGVLWALFLETAGDRLGDHASVTAEAVAEAVDAGVAAVRQIGKASPGDKSMLDAMVPFSESLRSAVDAGQGLTAASTRAAETAHDAARATASLRARVGRARPLADRSVGTPDPGATSFAMCARAAADAPGRADER